jgi:hypothetical protein
MNVANVIVNSTAMVLPIRRPPASFIKLVTWLIKKLQ